MRGVRGEIGGVKGEIKALQSEIKRLDDKIEQRTRSLETETKKRLQSCKLANEFRVQSIMSITRLKRYSTTVSLRTPA